MKAGVGQRFLECLVGCDLLLLAGRSGAAGATRGAAVERLLLGELVPVANVGVFDFLRLPDPVPDDPFLLSDPETPISHKAS